MIKDLVVNLGLGKPRDVAADYAISIAETFGAHACGVAFAYEPVVPPSVMGGIPAEAIDAQWAASEKAADAAIAAFEETARREGISVQRGFGPKPHRQRPVPRPEKAARALCRPILRGAPKKTTFDWVTCAWCLLAGRRMITLSSQW